MQVYFDSSLWKEKGDDPCERRQYIHAQFTEGGLERGIPTIYCFSKGIVFDILTIIDTEKLQNYFKTYKNIEKEAVAMSDVQMRGIKQDNPYQNIEIDQMWINGRAVELKSSSSSGIFPNREIGNKAFFTKMQESYAEFLGGAESFLCQRVCVKTQEDFTVQQLKCIKIKTKEKQQVFYFSREMELEAGAEGKLQMVHPVTHKIHEIYLYDIQMSGELSLEESRITYFIGTAEVVPKLLKEESLLFDSTISYSAHPKKAGAVSIIGGQSGPTAIFMAGTEKEEKSRFGGSVFSCFSQPFVLSDGDEEIWKKEKGRFCIQGLEKTKNQGEEIEIYNIDDKDRKEARTLL